MCVSGDRTSVIGKRSQTMKQARKPNTYIVHTKIRLSVCLKEDEEEPEGERRVRLRVLSFNMTCTDLLSDYDLWCQQMHSQVSAAVSPRIQKTISPQR